MALSKVKNKLVSMFRGQHGDIYKAAKDYAEERGLNVGDVTAAAVSAYLSADEEGKEALETAIKESRGGKGGGQTDVAAAVKMFGDMAASVTTMFNAVNEMKNAVSINSMVSDFEALTTAMNKLKTAGVEKGAGSMEDKIADAFVQGIVNRMTGGGEPPPHKTVKTGKGEVKKVEDE